jgi:long-chain fatty acid transport protein
MATNGYFAYGFGTTAKGMAGVATALPQDSLVSATNPAGMVFLGDRLDVGLSFFNPSPRGFEANPDFATAIPNCPGCLPPAFIEPGEFESENDWFFIPSFGYNRMLDEKSSIGISIGGNGGMNTEYDIPVCSSSSLDLRTCSPFPAPFQVPWFPFSHFLHSIRRRI